MPFLTYDPFPQCLQQSPLTPLLLARVTSEEVGAIYQTLIVSRPEAPEPVLPEVTPGLSRTRIRVGGEVKRSCAVSTARCFYFAWRVSRHPVPLGPRRSGASRWWSASAPTRTRRRWRTRT